MATFPVDGKYSPTGAACTAVAASTPAISALPPADSNPASANYPAGRPDYPAGGSGATPRPESGTPPHEIDLSGMPEHLAYAMGSISEEFADGAQAAPATTYRSSTPPRRSRNRGDTSPRDACAYTKQNRDIDPATIPPEANTAAEYPPEFDLGEGGSESFQQPRGFRFLTAPVIAAKSTPCRETETPRRPTSVGSNWNNTLAFSPARSNALTGAPQSLNTNVMALNAYRNVLSAQQILNDSLMKLSSGQRINTAGDDAAGLAIAENMRSQMLGSKQAVRNAQDGISLVQTAEGVLGVVHNMLQRMRVLAVRGANGSNGIIDRGNIVTEMDSIRLEIGRIGEATEVLGRKILGDKYTIPADALRFQIGPNGTDMDTIAVTFVDVVDIARDQLGHIPQDASHEAFQGAIRNIDGQIGVISTARATLGAVMSRFENTINSLNVTVENLSAARSRIEDTDFTLAASQFMRGKILTNSSHAMLSHALLAPRGVLSLLSVRSLSVA